jgi:hypothetical protein
MLELANRDLVDSHLHAVWLACTEKPLDPSISELLVLPDEKRPLREDVRAPMAEPRVAAEAAVRMGRVLDLIAEDLTEDAAPWYTGRDAYARHVAEGALSRFGAAFNRWRHLYRAAEDQRDAADRVVRDHAAPPAEKRAAKNRWIQAIEQLELLQQGDQSRSASDFYTYRYLATEGFLPGYNFPRLPLMAYIPKADARGRQTFLQRPRFLALSEFGPRSLVYHEGRAFRVVRAMLSIGHRKGATADTKLATENVRICASCGAGHFDEVSVCHACRLPLGDVYINNVYRIENVATHPAERITANDEERQRQGFELQTTFQWAVRDGEVDARNGSAADEHGEIVRLAYGQGARITRLNKGLRRRANKSVCGFSIDPVSGYWKKGNDEEDQTPDPTVAPPQLIVPSVQDHKNALLVQPTFAELSETTLATVQHALLRGVEAVFQLEEGEVLAEPMPSRDARSGFLLYEATEGGAGVLTRIVAEASSLARVARQALRVMHYDVPEDGPLPEHADSLVDVPDTRCVAGCYRCLLSYYNQPDHEVIHRQDQSAKEILLRLAASSTRLLRGRPASRPPAPPDTATPAGGFLHEIRARSLPDPDPEPLVIGRATVPHCWRAHYVAAVLADTPTAARDALADRGFEIIDFADEPTWPDSFTRLARALGRAS